MPMDCRYCPAGEFGGIVPIGEMWSVVNMSPNTASARAPRMSSIIGKSFGRTKLFNKSLEGTLAFLIVCTVIGFFFAYIPLSIRLAGAFTAALVELLPLRASDNLRIPIMSGSVMEVMFAAMVRHQPADSAGNDIMVWMAHPMSVFSC